MKKQFIVTAALACCSLIAQAGILKESFTNLCQQTGTTPIEVPAQETNIPAIKQMQMAVIGQEATDNANKIIDTWDKANIALTIEEEDEPGIIYMASDTDNTQECVVIATQKSDSQMVVIYLVGDTTNLLDLISHITED